MLLFLAARDRMETIENKRRRPPGAAPFLVQNEFQE